MGSSPPKSPQHHSALSCLERGCSSHNPESSHGQVLIIDSNKKKAHRFLTGYGTAAFELDGFSGVLKGFSRGSQEVLSGSSVSGSSVGSHGNSWVLRLFILGFSGGAQVGTSPRPPVTIHSPTSHHSVTIQSPTIHHVTIQSPFSHPPVTIHFQ